MPEQNNFVTENKYPTLYVKDFGKIKEAEIELAPFTLFIGDNNSGKSYLLNLIWGLQKESLFDSWFFSLSKHKYMQEEQAYKDILTKVESFMQYPVTKEESITINFIDKDIDNIMTLTNIMLKNNKENFVRELFNSSTITVQEIQLRIPSDTHIDITYSVKKEISLTQNKYSIVVKWGHITFSGTINDDETFIVPIVQFLVQCVLFIFFPVTRPTVNATQIKPAFLPTARTGFLLMHKELAKKGLSEKFQLENTDKSISPNLLLQSTIFFMHTLLDLRATNNYSNVKEIIDYMEDKIINGSLIMHPETREFFYTPKETEKQLPMHMSSAVVTELAPLLLYLKYHSLAEVLFMEEPEISLHPELQQNITRVLIKLINSCDQQIFISTHSDTIIQHINNMIKLSNNKPEDQKDILEEFGENYDESDIISQDKIRMYQFDVDKITQKTTISELASSRYGFGAPTFSNFLNTMSDRIDTLLEKL